MVTVTPFLHLATTGTHIIALMGTVRLEESPPGTTLCACRWTDLPAHDSHHQVLQDHMGDLRPTTLQPPFPTSTLALVVPVGPRPPTTVLQAQGLLSTMWLAGKCPLTKPVPWGAMQTHRRPPHGATPLVLIRALGIA